MAKALLIIFWNKIFFNEAAKLIWDEFEIIRVIFMQLS